jgi:hypothetical protein
MQHVENSRIKALPCLGKDASSGYVDLVKLKLEADVDLKVVTIVPGREDTKNEGRAQSLTVENSCGQMRTDVAVKNEEMRDAVDANHDDWIDQIIAVRFNLIAVIFP